MAVGASRAVNLMKSDMTSSCEHPVAKTYPAVVENSLGIAKCLTKSDNLIVKSTTYCRHKPHICTWNLYLHVPGSVHPSAFQPTSPHHFPRSSTTIRIVPLMYCISHASADAGVSAWLLGHFRASLTSPPPPHPLPTSPPPPHRRVASCRSVLSWFRRRVVRECTPPPPGATAFDACRGQIGSLLASGWPAVVWQKAVCRSSSGLLWERIASEWVVMSGWSVEIMRSWL